MSCPKCRTPLPDGSAFCNRCGASVGAPAPAMAAPAAGPTPADPEQELWRGRYSGKAVVHLWILWLLWLGALAFLWFRFKDHKLLASAAAKYVLLGASGLPAVGILWAWFGQWVGTRYRLTNYRLFKETGILMRHMNEVELVRVDDVSVRQNLLQRIFNVGVITVIAPSDPTEPRLELVGIENPIEVKEQIRTHVRKRREKSLHVESL